MSVYSSYQLHNEFSPLDLKPDWAFGKEGTEKKKKVQSHGWTAELLNRKINLSILGGKVTEVLSLCFW